MKLLYIFNKGSILNVILDPIFLTFILAPLLYLLIIKPLQNIQNNLQKVFDAAPIAILLVDDNAVVKQVNFVLSKLVNKDVTEIVELQPGNGLGCVNSDEHSKGCGYGQACLQCPIRSSIKSVLSSGQAVHEIEVQATLLVDGNEVEFWLEVSVEPLILNGKKNAIVAINDISNRKRAEEKLQSMNNILETRNDALDKSHCATVKLMREARQSEKELKTAKEKTELVNQELVSVQKQITDLNASLEKTVEQRTECIQELLKQKNRFIRQLGHDLKTPLVPLIAGLPIVLESIEDEKNDIRISRCLDSVNYINKLVKKTLHFMHASSKEYDLACENIDLTAITSEITDSWQTVLEDKHFEVINYMSQPYYIFAEPTMVREVIENVISNAVKYAGDAYIGLITLGAVTKKNYVVITISDNGIGIESKELEHIFEEFYKADPSRHDRTSIGLGLSICKEIMDKFNGSISIYSKGLGKGTKVVLEFPAKEVVKTVDNKEKAIS